MMSTDGRADSFSLIIKHIKDIHGIKTDLIAIYFVRSMESIKKAKSNNHEPITCKITDPSCVVHGINGLSQQLNYRAVVTKSTTWLKSTDWHFAHRFNVPACLCFSPQYKQQLFSHSPLNVDLGNRNVIFSWRWESVFQIFRKAFNTKKYH
jgi:hypothetical protein